MLNQLRQKLNFTLLSTHSILLIARIANKVFLSAYLLKITSSISDVALYYFIYYLSSLVVFIASAKFCKKGGALWLYRLGLFLFLSFFMIIAYAKEAIAEYIIPLGILYGLALGFYWLPYDLFRYQLIDQKERKLYFSYEKLVDISLKIGIPIIAGFSIWQSGSHFTLFFSAALLFVIAVGLTIFLKPKNNEDKQYHPMAFAKKIKTYPDVIYSYKALLLGGLSFYGALEILIFLLIYLSQGDELRLGLIASMMPLISIVVAYCLGHYLKAKRYSQSTWIGILILILGTLALIIEVNKLSIIIFSFAFAASMPILTIMLNTYTFNVLDQHKDLSKERVEHLIMREISIDAGRLSSFGILFFLGQITLASLSLKVVILLLTLPVLWMGYCLKKIGLDY